MLPALAAAFILVPFAELAVIISVGRVIGVWPTVGLLLVFSLLGAWLARREGVAAWRRFRRALDEGRVPTAEVADGFLILLAGALLLAPGFLSDAVGLVLLVPPVRAAVRRRAPALALRRLRRARTRVVDGTARPGTRVTWSAPTDDPVAPPPLTGRARRRS